jgi:hypothetical protein
MMCVLLSLRELQSVSSLSSGNFRKRDIGSKILSRFCTARIYFRSSVSFDKPRHQKEKGMRISKTSRHSKTNQSGQFTDGTAHETKPGQQAQSFIIGWRNINQQIISARQNKITRRTVDSTFIITTSTSTNCTTATILVSNKS